MIVHGDYSFPVSRLFLPGKTLAYLKVGNAPKVLIFLHGFGSNAEVWSPSLQYLREHYTCFALDLPGHGLSSKEDYPYSIPFYAETVQEWLEALKIQPYALIGHSMGGQTALKLVQQSPDLFQKLALVAPAGFEQFSHAEQLLLKQFTSLNVIGGSQYFKSLLNFKNYFHRLDEKEYEKLRELSRDFYSLQSNPMLPKILARSVAGMMDSPVFQDLPHIALPTLIHFGKQDLLIPNRLFKHESTAQIAQKACNQMPDARLILYEAAGHFLQYQYPKSWSEDLRNFLRSREM